MEIYNRGFVYTMDHEVIPWNMAFSMVQLPWSHFLKNQFTKLLGPSLGVNQTWTKRNDHAPKSECIRLFLIYVQKGQFEKNNQVWSLFCLVFSSLHILFPQQNHSNFIITIFLWMGHFVFSTISPILPLPLHNPLDHANDDAWLKICHLETSNSMVTLTCFSIGVNRNHIGTSSTTNQSHILQGLGTTSWSMVETTPQYPFPKIYGVLSNTLLKNKSLVRTSWSHSKEQMDIVDDDVRWLGKLWVNIMSLTMLQEGWGEPPYTLVLWRQGFKHPTRNECIGWFTHILQEPMML